MIDKKVENSNMKGYIIPVPERVRLTMAEHEVSRTRIHEELGRHAEMLGYHIIHPVSNLNELNWFICYEKGACKPSTVMHIFSDRTNGYEKIDLHSFLRMSKEGGALHTKEDDSKYTCIPLRPIHYYPDGKESAVSGEKKFQPYFPKRKNLEGKEPDGSKWRLTSLSSYAEILRKGKSGVGIGYSCDISKSKDGAKYNGVPFDVVIENIHPSHVLSVQDIEIKRCDLGQGEDVSGLVEIIAVETCCPHCNNKFTVKAVTK